MVVMVVKWLMLAQQPRYRPSGRSVTARWKPLGPDSAGGTDHGVQFQSARHSVCPQTSASRSVASLGPLL